MRISPFPFLNSTSNHSISHLTTSHLLPQPLPKFPTTPLHSYSLLSTGARVSQVRYCPSSASRTFYLPLSKSPSSYHSLGRSTKALWDRLPYAPASSPITLSLIPPVPAARAALLSQCTKEHFGHHRQLSHLLLFPLLGMLVPQNSQIDPHLHGSLCCPLLKTAILVFPSSSWPSPLSRPTVSPQDLTTIWSNVYFI